MASHYARRSGEDPDDLLQEAWLGLFEAVPEVDLGIGQPEQFLLQRARWRLLAAIRHARLRRSSPLEEAAEPEAPFTEVPEADFTARLGATQRSLASCLLAGLTFREAGEQLGCSSANVAYHARRLRQAFVEWQGEPL
jgi:RNA polymerase sigma-70 factor (ECF subfamily)